MTHGSGILPRPNGVREYHRRHYGTVITRGVAGAFEIARNAAGTMSKMRGGPRSISKSIGSARPAPARDLRAPSNSLFGGTRSQRRPSVLGAITPGTVPSARRQTERRARRNEQVSKTARRRARAAHGFCYRVTRYLQTSRLRERRNDCA